VELFVLTSRDVMAHEYLPFSLLLHFFVRDCGPIKVLNTAELSQLAQTMDESDFVVERERRRALKWGGRRVFERDGALLDEAFELG